MDKEAFRLRHYICKEFRKWYPEVTHETLLRVQNRLLEMNLDELKAKSEQVKRERNVDVGEVIDETEKNIKEYGLK